MAACAGIADYLDLIATSHGLNSVQDVHDLIRSYEIKLLQSLLDAVSERNSVRLIGPSDAERRAPTVAIDLGRPAGPVAEALAHHKIMAGGGDFYAGRALDAVGVKPENGVLRLSFVHYTTKQEIDQLLNALDDVL